MNKSRELLKWDMTQKVAKEIKLANKELELRSNIYIPSIQAKDILLAQAYNKEIRLTDKNGNINTRKYISTVDYSKEQVKLREVYDAIYGRCSNITTSLYNSEDKLIKVFSYSVMCLSFEYAVKTWNRYNYYEDKKTYACYVKYGYDFNDLVWDDYIARIDNRIVGVILDKKYEKLEKDLKKPFAYNEESHTYCIVDNLNENICIERQDQEFELTADNTRTYIYENGFDYNGKHYRRYKRASGSAREGRCLFIDEALYNDINTWELMGLAINATDEIDLAGLEAYISLTMSGCETKEIIKIKPEEILFIPVLKDEFESECIAVEEYEDKENLDEEGKPKHHLKTEKKTVIIKNKLNDGECLIEADMIGNHGMALLRNRMFKGCAFGTRLQKFFKDNGITNLNQINGITLATDISQIKLVINETCVKFCKFGVYEDWLKQVDDDFFVVKNEHVSKLFFNNMVYAHYQLLNTLQLSKQQVRQLLKPNFDYMNLVNTDVNVLKYHLKQNHIDADFINGLLDINSEAENINNVYNTKKEAMKSFRNQAKQGSFLIHGQYQVLFGNPLDYLLSTIKKEYRPRVQDWDGAVCFTKKYKDGEQLVLCRSPHVFAGNLALLTNVHNADMDRYFNLTDNIICLNSKGENIMERLSSCDYDSDQAIVTNEEIVVDAVRKNYELFGVPTSLVEAASDNGYKYNMTDLARLDNITAHNSAAIGEIINFSQVLQSLMWDKINKGSDCKSDEIQQIINDCALLDVMSCICIDSCKKNYSQFKLQNELQIIKDKYKNSLMQPIKTDENGNTIMVNVVPDFFKVVDDLKGYSKPEDKYAYFYTTMSYVLETINKYRAKGKEYIKQSLNKSLQLDVNIGVINKNEIHKEQAKDIIKKAVNMQKKISKNQSESNETTFETNNMIKNTYYTYVKNLKMNKQTLYKVCRCLDDEELELGKIKRYVLFGLMTNPIWNEVFDVMTNRLVRVKTEEEADYTLYGFYFAITRQ